MFIPESSFEFRVSSSELEEQAKSRSPLDCKLETGNSKLRERGVSLVELVVFIVIVSAAVAGIIGVMSITTQSSADPVVRKQALAIAEAVLEEVQLQPFTYCDPDDPGAATADMSGGALAFDARTTGGGTGNPIDVTHTISGGNRYVFVQVVNGNSWPTISSVVWDPAGVNEALSVIATATYSSDVRTVLYGRVNPTAGTRTIRRRLSERPLPTPAGQEGLRRSPSAPQRENSSLTSWAPRRRPATRLLAPVRPNAGTVSTVTRTAQALRKPVQPRWS
jgi:Tfp pilus assembly protein PilV